MSTENIDWSKAPEGATHAEMGPFGHPIWYAIQVGKSYWWRQRSPSDASGDWTSGPDLDGMDEWEARPCTPWSGEGLPPVGTACEMLSHGEEESEWIEVQILAHTKINGEDHAVFQYEEHVGTGSVQGSCFRPVRTDQERGVDLVLSEIEALYAEGGPAAIYDAGYRKIDPAGAHP